jgi:hypothetical protein
LTFEISSTAGPFGNATNPTNFTGFGGEGYRSDANGWCSLTFVQDLGATGTWKQVRWNSTLDNGVGNFSGGYEQIIWDSLTRQHNVAQDSQGDPIRYDYSNTTLPYGDLDITIYVNPALGDQSDANEANWEWPFPWMHGDETDTFTVRVMHFQLLEQTQYIGGIQVLTIKMAHMGHGRVCGMNKHLQVLKIITLQKPVRLGQCCGLETHLI